MRLAFLEALEPRRLCSSSPIPGNWDLQWSDEFNARPATPTWVKTLWGTTHFGGELENYTPNNVTASNGILSLTAKREISNGFPYTSGLVDTGGDFATGGPNLPGMSFKYGYVEARMKLTKGAGLWPAFWMVPTPYPDGTYHDGDGEIDIMEQIGTAPTRTEAHLHHHGTVGKSYNTGVDLSAAFHTYGLDWEPDHLTWYFDGTPFFTVTANVPNVPEYLIFNLAVGDTDSWPGAPDASTVFPASFQVDYVRLYRQAPAGTGPAAPSAPDLLPASDTGMSASDNVTRLNNAAPAAAPQFQVGGTVAGATVMVYADGAPIGSAVATGDTTVVTTSGSSALADGTHTITARQADANGVASGDSAALMVTVDSVGPAVTDAAFVDAPGAQAVRFTFNENVAGTLDVTDLSARRLPNGPDLAVVSVGYDPATSAATFAFGGAVADGDYAATLLAGPSNAPAVTDMAGNPLAGDGPGGSYVYPFTRMAGLFAAPGSIYAFTGPADNKLLTVSAGTVTLNEDLSSVYPLISLDVTGGTVVFATNQQFQSVSLAGDGVIMDQQPQIVSLPGDGVISPANDPAASASPTETQNPGPRTPRIHAPRINRWLRRLRFNNVTPK
jgi:beta-glucanase (GH16 family)